MADTAFASALRAKLDDLEGVAQTQWWNAGAELERTLGITDESWRAIVEAIGRDLTRELWEIAIEEASALALGT